MNSSNNDHHAEATSPDDAGSDSRDALELLLQGHVELPELARHMGGDLRTLGAWAMQPDTLRALEGLLRLNDARLQMTVGRYRMVAATMLLRLVTEQEPGELVRKACVDLLTIDPVVSPKRPMSAAAAAADRHDSIARSGPHVSEETIARALEALGRAEHEPASDQ